ncbi:FAD:protein FMN transferase [Sharpea azabuensis]|uniref:FAD:protein FMN transferase n=1 Tax=Sharpea azabuensis TaxID=322505 RepID=UPI00156B4B68|nr:FAD:protein FMN transferase [Sharpea azabuensis]
MIEHIFFALGTVNSIKIYDKNSKNYEPLLKHIQERIEYISSHCNFYDDQSDLSHINQQAGESYVTVDQDTYMIIREAKAYSVQYKGFFDITVGPLTRLWHINTNNNEMPLKQDIDRAILKINAQDILLKEDNQVALAHHGQAIDLGSIAKGYCVDLTKELLIKAGVTEAIIQYGGSVAVIGKKKKVGIQNPFKSQGEIMGYIETDACVVTSGTYEHYFMHDNKRYSHLFDLRTGYPIETDMMSLTVVTSSALLGDVLTTVYFNKGVIPRDEDVCVIMNDGRYYLSESLRKEFYAR